MIYLYVFYIVLITLLNPAPLKTSPQEKKIFQNFIYLYSANRMSYTYLKMTYYFYNLKRKKNKLLTNHFPQLQYSKAGKFSHDVKMLLLMSENLICITIRN
jgi:hypothetical protein